MKTNKKYDSVKMMREIRSKISYEIMDMNTDQILSYIKEGQEQYEKETKKRP